MNSLAQKLEYLKWLKSIGIGYYFSDKKDSNISLISALTLQAQKHINKPIKEKVGLIAKDVVNAIIPNKVMNSSTILTEVLESRKLASLAGSLDELKEIVTNFNGCSLKDFALNTVFSDGVSNAKIMLIGEAPGAREDALGIPFCGESGILLDTMLELIGLSRKENIYITNTIFWRPPANRKPTKQETDICKPFLERHIAFVKPKLIICVGATAVAGLLGDKITINDARKNIYFYKNEYLEKPINIIGIFHPAYLLRQSGKKKDTWFDLIKIQEFIEKNF